MEDFVAGTVGGVAGLIVGHPADTLRVRMQAAAASTTAAAAHGQQQLGALQLMRQLSSQESPLALFKGMMSPMVSRAANNALFFGVYGLMAQGNSDNNGARTTQQIALAGAAAGLVPSIVVCPSELIKCRMQVNRDVMFGGQRPGFLATARGIVASGSGWPTLFRGFSMVVARDVPYSAAYFVVYERLKAWLAAPRSGINGTAGAAEERAWHRFLAGGLAGVVGWSICYPFDTIKTAMQVSNERIGALEWTRRTYQAHGIRPLYRALTLTLARSFPVSATSMVCFEYTKDVLLQLGAQAKQRSSSSLSARHATTRRSGNIDSKYSVEQPV